jgi:hypothetical protein
VLPRAPDNPEVLPRAPSDPTMLLALPNATAYNLVERESTAIIHEEEKNVAAKDSLNQAPTTVNGAKKERRILAYQDQYAISSSQGKIGTQITTK